MIITCNTPLSIANHPIFTKLWRNTRVTPSLPEEPSLN
uniref:Uncharacterized protein n=1 Tax=Lepeophtheirus salmonis TaxID=72036 RepID=A0A0K2TRB8_LEPSM